METADNKKGLVFTGFTKSMMLFNKKTNRWNIISLDDESVIMELDAEVKEIMILKLSSDCYNSEKAANRPP